MPPNKDTITNNSHFNPCFWTALWNDAYLDATLRGDPITRSARNEVVAYYNIQGGKILEDKVSNIHKHKGLGFAEFTYESAVAWWNVLKKTGNGAAKIRRWRPDDPVFLDAETIFSGMENMPTYKAVLNVVRTNKIEGPKEKADLASFFVIHDERIQATWAAQPDRKASKKHNLEHIIALKHRLSDRDYLFKRVFPVACWDCSDKTDTRWACCGLVS